MNSLGNKTVHGKGHSDMFDISSMVPWENPDIFLYLKPQNLNLQWLTIKQQKHL